MPEVSDSGGSPSLDIDLGHFVVFYIRSPRWWFQCENTAYQEAVAKQKQLRGRKLPHSSKQETPQTPQRYCDLSGTRNTSASTTGTSEFHDANATWVQVVMTLKEPRVNEMAAI